MMKVTASFRSCDSVTMTIDNDDMGFRFDIDGTEMVVDYDDVDDLIKYLSTFRGDK